MQLGRDAAVRDIPSPRTPIECPVEDWLAFLGHRWNALILWHLTPASKRHGELMRCLPGIAAKVLAERLHGLEKRGLVAKTQVAAFPRKVVYSLTQRGRDVVVILDRIELWAKTSAH